MAKSFIHNLGNCIYKEFSTVLSHDDLQFSFKEAVKKLPKGALRKKIRKNLDKYLELLEKHVSDLSGTEVPSISASSQDDSLQELSSLENRKDVADKSLTEHKVALNLHRQNPDLPDENILRDVGEKQKREIYSSYTRQALQRRDVSYEKLCQVIDKLEELLPQPAEVKTSGFSWQCIMDHLVQLSVGLSGSAVTRLLRLLFKKVEKDVDKCLLKEKPVRSGKLAKILKSYLQVFHMRIQHAKDLDDRPYCRFLTALLSYYIDLACVHSSKTDNRALQGRQACGFVSYLLLPWPERILEVVLQSSMVTENHADFISPLIRKCVSLKPEKSADHEHYLKYILVVRLARDGLGSTEQTLELTLSARQVAAGVGFLDWLLDKCPESSEHLPTEDKKFQKSYITKFLLDEAETSLIHLLIDSLRSPAATVTEESFMTMYSEADGAQPAEALDTVQKGEPDIENLFFLDTAGARSTKGGKAKTKKSPVVLRNLAEMGNLLDSNDDTDTSEQQGYRLATPLLDKFVDPQDKEFVKSEIVSIRKLTPLDLEGETEKSGYDNGQSTSSPIKQSSEILVQSKSGKGKVKELHTSGSNMSDPIFVSESETDTSMAENHTDANTMKSVVRVVTPKKVIVPKEELTSNAENSDTELSEATTVISMDSEVAYAPPNSSVSTVGSEMNLSTDIEQRPLSLLSEISGDRTLSSVTAEEVVSIDSDTEDQGDAGNDDKATDENKNNDMDKTVSTLHENTLEIAVQDSIEIFDSNEETEVTVVEGKTGKTQSPMKKTSSIGDSSTRKSTDRKLSKSPAANESSKKSIGNDNKQADVLRKHASPGIAGRSQKKSKGSDSSRKSDSGKAVLNDAEFVVDESSDGNITGSTEPSDRKDESSVFIEINDTEDEVGDKESPEKSLEKFKETSPSKKQKSMMEKFIEKAEKSKPGWKVDSQDAIEIDSEKEEIKTEAELDHMQTRNKSTEEIAMIVEEIHQKLTESSKKRSRTGKAAETSMFTDESVVSSDSEIKDTKKTPRKGSKSSQSGDKIQSDNTVQQTPKRRSSDKVVDNNSNKENVLTEKSETEKSERKPSSDKMMKDKVRKLSGDVERTEECVSTKKSPRKKSDSTATNASSKQQKTSVKMVLEKQQDISIEGSDESDSEIMFKPTSNEDEKSPDKKDKSRQNSKDRKLSMTDKKSSDSELRVLESEDEKGIKETTEDKRSVKTPSSNKKDKTRKRSGENTPSTLELDSESALSSKKKRLSSAEDAIDEPILNGGKNSATKLRRRTMLKMPASAEKLKRLKSQSGGQVSPDDQLATGNCRTPTKQSQSEDVIPSSNKKTSSGNKLLDVYNFDSGTESRIEKVSKSGVKSTMVLVSDSESEVEVPNIGKHLKVTEDDDHLISGSPKIMKKQEKKVTSGKLGKPTNDKEQVDDAVEVESSPEKVERVTRRKSLRPRHLHESEEMSDSSATEKKTKPATRGKRVSISVAQPVLAQKKDSELQSETDQSETDTRVTRKSVGGRNKTAGKATEKNNEAGGLTPKNKAPVRKLSASTSKKAAVGKVEVLTMDRKRRLSGELSAADQASIRRDSTDSEVTFPKLKKGGPSAPKQPTRTSKRASVAPADDSTTVPARRYPSRKK